MRLLGNFCLRITFVTLVIGTIAGAYVAGYHVGWRECLREWYFQPAIFTVAADQSSRGLMETEP